MYMRDVNEMRETCEMLQLIMGSTIKIDKTACAVTVSVDSLNFVLSNAYSLLQEMYNVGSNSSIIVEQIPYSEVTAILTLNNSNNKLSTPAFDKLTGDARVLLHRMCWTLRGDERNVIGGAIK